MKICRFKNKPDEIRIGFVADNSTLLDLNPAGITELFPLLENENSVAELNQLDKNNLPRISLAEVKLLAPVERQEVWAAGVTYPRSKTARMGESDFSATAYCPKTRAKPKKSGIATCACQSMAMGESTQRARRPH